MHKLTDYFEKYKEINSNHCDYKSLFSRGDQHIWYFLTDIPEIRKRINFNSYDVVPYAALLYATNLLSQVIHSNFGWAILSFHDEKKSVFPEIFGFLYTADAHVCPSVPATLVIYWTENMSQDDDCGWSIKLEKETWNHYHDNFSEAIQWTKLNLDMLLQHLTDKKFTSEELMIISQIIDDEHIRINIDITQSNASTRIANY
jgi:hypothetical protein